MSHVSRKYGQFSYFDQQLGHPDWRGKRVLDFGGNAGNILRAPDCAIEPELYWCIDVSRDGLAEGERDFPKAHWIWYDRYNVEFHPSGERTTPLPDCGRFDYIVCYSVFTHMDLPEMDEMAAGLCAMLNPGGAFAFTFIDPHFHSWPERYSGSNLAWRLERMSPRVKSEAAVIEAGVRNLDCFTLIGDGDIYPGATPVADSERYRGQEYHVFHTAQFMRDHFPGAEILPPANGEMQHCCVLRRSDGPGAADNRA